MGFVADEAHLKRVGSRRHWGKLVEPVFIRRSRPDDACCIAEHDVGFHKGPSAAAVGDEAAEGRLLGSGRRTAQPDEHGEKGSPHYVVERR